MVISVDNPNGIVLYDIGIMKDIFVDIGITKGSAVVMVDHENKSIAVLKRFCAGELIDLFLTEKGTIFIEDSNLIKGSWHGATSRENVGKNKGFSSAIFQILNHKGITIKPLKPSGYSSFFEKHKLEKIFKNKPKKTNTDQRAALAMAFLHSSSPIQNYLFI